MSLLEQLAASALLGTDRRPPALPHADGALGAALAAQPWSEDPAAAVLRSAALATIHDRAGANARRLDGDLPAPAPAEPTRQCSPAAATVLSRVLADPQLNELLAVWLLRAADRGEHAPPMLLPQLLDRGEQQRTLRPALLQGSGVRLSWLAAQHPKWWTWAAPVPAVSPSDPGDDIGAWHTEAFDARLLLLTTLRERDPAAGRALVASTWEQDPPNQRGPFVRALRTGLERADEPLLERALRDRRKEVRTPAIELLSALRGSAYRARMGERLRPLVGTEGRLRTRLAVELPQLPDAAAKRDGLSGRARDGLGERAATLAEIVAGAGLAIWTGELTGAQTPDQVIDLARRTDHEPALRAGWRAAARRERNAAWCSALAVAEGDPSLLEDLPSEQIEPAAISLLGTAGAAYGLIWTMPEPWSESFSAAIVRWLVARPDPFPDRPTMRRIGSALHPSTLVTAVREATRLRDRDPGAFDTFLHVLDLHQAILRELPTP